MFKDRFDAAEQLSEKLNTYDLKNAVILAIPEADWNWATFCLRSLAFR